MSCDNCENYHEYASDNIHTWCTNCGNYGIMAALKRALVAEGVKPKDALLCFDVGCNGNGADKMDGYRFHGLHGRVLPFAAGAAISNRRMKVIASAGDGATLSEGINHFIHSIRQNYNITFILHNNGNYGLTTGQASATTKPGTPMNSAPEGVHVQPINVAELVLSLNPSFVARGFSGNVKQMTELFRAGMQHTGFSFIEILQNCPTYNKATPHEWYQERVYDTFEIQDYDFTNLAWAKVLAADLEERIATGILYRQPEMADFYAQQHARHQMPHELVDEVASVDIAPILGEFK